MGDSSLQPQRCRGTTEEGMEGEMTKEMVEAMEEDRLAEVRSQEKGSAGHARCHLLLD